MFEPNFSNQNFHRIVTHLRLLLCFGSEIVRVLQSNDSLVSFYLKDGNKWKHLLICSFSEELKGLMLKGLTMTDMVVDDL